MKKYLIVRPLQHSSHYSPQHVVHKQTSRVSQMQIKNIGKGNFEY